MNYAEQLRVKDHYRQQFDRANANLSLAAMALDAHGNCTTRLRAFLQAADDLGQLCLQAEDEEKFCRIQFWLARYLRRLLDQPEQNKVAAFDRLCHLAHCQCCEKLDRYYQADFNVVPLLNRTESETLTAATSRSV